MELFMFLLAFFWALASSAPSFPVAVSKQGKVLISSSLGRSVVVNACPFAVNSNIVHSPRPGGDGPPEELVSVLAPGESAGHPFLHDPGMGISWKLAPDSAPSAPVQFEWTWVPDQNRAYWDLSMIDAGAKVKRSLVVPAARRQEDGTPPSSGEDSEVPAAPADLPVFDGGIAHPFAQYGMTLQPMLDGAAVDAQGMCGTVACNAGETACRAAYNFAEDWSRQHDCPEAVSLQLTLCG